MTSEFSKILCALAWSNLELSLWPHHLPPHIFSPFLSSLQPHSSLRYSSVGPESHLTIFALSGVYTAHSLINISKLLKLYFLRFSLTTVFKTVATTPPLPPTTYSLANFNFIIAVNNTSQCYKNAFIYFIPLSPTMQVSQKQGFCLSGSFCLEKYLACSMCV